MLWFLRVQRKEMQNEEREFYHREHRGHRGKKEISEFALFSVASSDERVVNKSEFFSGPNPWTMVD